MLYLQYHLLRYPEDSAGSIMTVEFVDLKENLTVEQAIQRIRNVGVDSETINICYVLDSRRTLLGTVALRYLLLSQPDEIIGDITNDATTEYVSVSYVIDEGGVIEGDEEQVILKGSDASTVTAVADDGYVFKEWSDGYASPTRTDKAVGEDVTYEAIFTELDDGDGDGDGDG